MKHQLKGLDPKDLLPADMLMKFVKHMCDAIDSGEIDLDGVQATEHRISQHDYELWLLLDPGQKHSPFDQGIK